MTKNNVKFVNKYGLDKSDKTDSSRIWSTCRVSMFTKCLVKRGWVSVLSQLKYSVCSGQYLYVLKKYL